MWRQSIASRVQAKPACSRLAGAIIQSIAPRALGIRTFKKTASPIEHSKLAGRSRTGRSRGQRWAPITSADTFPRWPRRAARLREGAGRRCRLISGPRFHPQENNFQQHQLRGPQLCPVGTPSETHPVSSLHQYLRTRVVEELPKAQLPSAIAQCSARADGPRKRCENPCKGLMTLALILPNLMDRQKNLPIHGPPQTRTFTNRLLFRGKGTLVQKNALAA